MKAHSNNIPDIKAVFKERCLPHLREEGILGSFKKNHIVDVEFLPTILNPETAIQKQSIVDVLCKDKNGVKYIIEMQVSAAKEFEKRAQYYAAKVYGDQARIGEEYHDLKGDYER